MSVWAARYLWREQVGTVGPVTLAKEPSLGYNTSRRQGHKRFFNIFCWAGLLFKASLGPGQGGGWLGLDFLAAQGELEFSLKLLHPKLERLDRGHRRPQARRD